MSVEVSAVSALDNLHSLSNMLFLHPSTLSQLTTTNTAYVEVNNFILTATCSDKVEPGTCTFNSAHRKFCKLSIGDKIHLSKFSPPAGAITELHSMTVSIQFFVKKKAIPCEIDADDVQKWIHGRLKNQYFSLNQEIVMEQEGRMFLLTVCKLSRVAVAALGDKVAHEPADAPLGRLVDTTTVVTQSVSTDIKVKGNSKTREVFRPDFSFENLGIGGLDDEFGQIFRRAFASRMFPPKVIEKLGINHVRGMLLFGPPGTGKTLIARQLSKMLNGKEPKIVNGPEILSKYVGQSEENIRKLFADAETEYAEKGEESDLHVIIFDEIDAICKQRGSTRDNTGVHDTMVNQLLSKIDGVDALNNILLIGMTNRKDMMDEAILRPGRLEVHVEISLPDEVGRQQILKIHTQRMSKSGFMDTNVDLLELAKLTKNFTGAEIEGLCKSAVSFALSRQVNIDDLGKNVNPDELHVSMDDFLGALSEIKPAYGAKTTQFDNILVDGFLDRGSEATALMHRLRLTVDQVRTSTPLMSLLLQGGPGSGKTSVAVKTAMDSEFPFVRIITAEDLDSWGDKRQAIRQVFQDSRKSALSVVILDNIEDLIEYVPIGPMFNNSVLQTMRAYLRAVQPPNKRLFVIGTTSNPDALRQLGVVGGANPLFADIETVPALSEDEVPSILAQLPWFSNEISGTVSEIMAREGAEVGIKQFLNTLKRSLVEIEGATAAALSTS
eukprot:Rmarinus@m.14696